MMVGHSSAMQHVYKLIGQVQLRCYGSDSRRVGYWKRACGQRYSFQQREEQGTSGQSQLRCDS